MLYRARRRVILLILLPLMFAAMASAQDGATAVPDSTAPDPNGGILYGPGYAYYLHAATGWRMDDEFARQMGANAVFYPDSLTPETTPVLIQAGIWYKTDSLTVEDIMHAYDEAYRGDHPGAKIAPCPSLVTEFDDTVAVRSYLTTGEAFSQRISFHDAPKLVVWIMLMSRTKPDEGLAAFEETVRSYRWITDNLQLPPGPR